MYAPAVRAVSVVTRIAARSDGLVGAIGASKPKFIVWGLECIAQWKAQEWLASSDASAVACFCSTEAFAEFAAW